MITSTVARISVAELKARLDGGTGVVVVDVRGKDSYDARRIRGAISLPKKDPATNWEALPRDKALVLY